MKLSELPKELILKFYNYKKQIENLRELEGNTPPSIFISSNNKNLGILLPPIKADTKIFEYPEEWYKRNFDISKILELRSQLIFSKLNFSEKNLENLQLVAMSKESFEMEVYLRNSPKFSFLFSNFHLPIANYADVEKLIISENVKVFKQIEKVSNDFDLKASNAVIELYNKSLEKSVIERVFSAGLLGLKIERKLVPTRYSITATDDIIGKFLINEIKYFEKIDKIRVYSNSYLGNIYHIILFPEVFSFELIEIDIKSKKFYEDYEFVFKRKNYAENTAGGYYASRLAVLEGLKKIKKQAAVIVIREILEFYPIGVWKVREAIKDAFNKQFLEFEDFSSLVDFLSKKLITKNQWLKISKLFKILKSQTKILNI